MSGIGKEEGGQKKKGGTLVLHGLLSGCANHNVDK